MMRASDAVRMLYRGGCHRIPQSKRVLHRLKSNWEAEQQRAERAPGSRPSLTRAFFGTFAGTLSLVTCMLLLKSGCILVQTQMLSRLLRHYRTPDEEAKLGYLYAMGIVLR